MGQLFCWFVPDILFPKILPIKQQKEKSLNSSKYLNVQDRTRTGCLRSLKRYVPDPSQALSVLFLLCVIIPEGFSKAN